MRGIFLPIENEFVSHEPCPHCGSHDALARYSDGHAYCFHCQYREGTNKQPMVADKQMIEGGKIEALPRRGISAETCQFWGYLVGDYNGKPCQIAQFKDLNGRVVAQKIRFADKSFKCLGDMKKAGLYGQHLWRDGGKRIVITEGEIDALSVAEVQGNKWPVVSLPNGASGAKKALQQSFDWLDKFEEIVLLFDNDEAGQKAVEACQTIPFHAGKVKVAKLPLKDASEMLQAGRGSEIISAIFSAKTFRPDGILSGADLWEKINTKEEKTTIRLPFSKLDEMTHGFRLGELWTFTAGSGTGKTATIREIAYACLKENYCVGMLMLEESIERTARGLIGLAIDKPAHIDWDNLTEEEKEKGFSETLGTGRVFLYDHFGSSDVANILAKIRYLAAGCGCQVIFLDHLSIIVSGTDDGDERRLIDNIMTELKTLAVEMNIAIVLVSHLKRPTTGDRGHEEGAHTSLAQLRGSHAIAQLSDFVVGLERNQQARDNSDVTTLRVLKNRYTGDTGEAGWLHYDHETGRLKELLDDPFSKADEDYSQTEESPF